MPASQNFVLAKGYPAAAALTKKRAVKFDGTNTQTVTPITAEGDRAIGIVLFNVSATELTKGKKASVMTEGRVIMEASEAINEGDVVGIAADGRAVSKAGGAHAGATSIGTCDEAASGAAKECSVHLSIR